VSDPAIVDLMTICLARLLRDGERVLHGVNSLLPMVAINVAKRLHAPRLVYLSVAGGVDPAPPRLPWSSTDQALTVGATSIFSNEDFYDLCARGGIDVVFLSAVQIDRTGRINTSAIGSYDRPQVRLPGGGGAAAIMPMAGRVILWRTQHTPRVFVERVDFATASGRLDRVVTPLCVLRYADGRLGVESIHPHTTPGEVQAQTGFDLGPLEAVPRTPLPTAAELAALADVDPDRLRDNEFR
jgi:glutaconate CoA-transferase subunit B